MSAALLYRKRYNAAKIEATAGTAEVLANADGNENFFDPTFEVDIPAFMREGQLSASPLSSVPGSRSAKASFTTHMWHGGTRSSVFWANTLLLAAGFTSNGSGVYSPITGGAQTVTAQLWVHGNAYTVAGAQMNLKINADKVGEPVKMMWEATGLNVNPGTLTAITPTFPTVPPIRFAAGALTITNGTNASFTPVLRKFELDMKNKVILREDANESTGAGFIGSVIVERDPTITMTIEATLLSAQDWFADQRNSAEVTISTTFIGRDKTGTSVGSVTLAAPKAQIRNAPKPVNVDGIFCYELEYGCNRNSSAGDDEITITLT